MDPDQLPMRLAHWWRHSDRSGMHNLHGPLSEPRQVHGGQEGRTTAGKISDNLVTRISELYSCTVGVFFWRPKRPTVLECDFVSHVIQTRTLSSNGMVPNFHLRLLPTAFCVYDSEYCFSF